MSAFWYLIEDGATSAAADMDLLALANRLARAELLALERGSEEDGTARRMGDSGDVMNEVDSDGFAVFDSLAFGRGLGSS